MADALRVNNIHFGNVASNHNQAHIGFTSVGIGSTANYGALQFVGVPNTLCWTANGTVGIGTTAPTGRFVIYGTSADHTSAPDGNPTNHQLIVTNNKSGISPYSMAIGMDQTHGCGYINAAGNGAFQPVCLQTRGGNVGVGTTAPLAPLHVYNALGVSLSNTATVNYTQSAILGFNYGGGTGVGTRDSFRILSQTVNRDNGAGPFFDYGAQADLIFQRKTNNLYSGGVNDMTYTEVMRIGGATGNVGIGTWNPLVKLQLNETPVNGDVTRREMLRGVREGTLNVQNAVSMAFALGADRTTISPFGCLDIKVNGGPGLSNNFGAIPDVTVMSVVGNGMVGIGTNNPISPLHLFTSSTGLPHGIMSVFSSNILSSTASSYDILQRWYESSSNASFVDLMWVRRSTGSNWETTSQRFQSKTDGTWQGFIEFNGPDNNYGVTIGTGSSTSNPNSVPGAMYIKQGGLVGIGTATINYSLQIGTTGSIIRIGGLTNQGSAVDTTTYGLERSRNQIQFSGYRDSLTDKVGAKIVGINKQTYGNTGLRHLIQSTDLAFFTVAPDSHNLDDTVERMRITDTGNVGIGSAAPTRLLDVKYGTNADSTGQPTGPFIARIYNATNTSQQGGLFIKNNWANSNATILEVGNDFVGGSYCSYLSIDGVGNTRFKVNNGGGVSKDVLYLQQTTSRVGINTDAPLARLTVRNGYDDGDTGGLCIDSSDGSVYNMRLSSFVQGASQVAYRFGVNNIALASPNTLVLGFNGNIGIGTDNPQAPLHIPRSSTISVGGGGFYFSTGTSIIGWPGNGTLATSIRVSDAIVTGASFIAASDIRVKKNIQPVRNSLQIIDQLNIVSYDKIDYISTGVDAGIIAQDIQDILPRTISKHTSFIPNIYQCATYEYINDNEIRVNVTCNDKDVKEGGRVQLKIVKGDKEDTYEASLHQLTGTSFVIKKWSDFSNDHKVFVYGTEVDDFLSVDKEQIGMLAAAGVKELYQVVKEQQAAIVSLQSQLDTVLARIAVTGNM